MYYFKFFTTLLLALFTSFLFAQSNPEIFVEKKSNTYNLKMKIEEDKSIAFVSIKGYNFDKKNNQNFENKYSYKDLFKKNSGEIVVKELNNETDHMYYTIYIEDTEGVVKSRPSKKIYMSDKRITSKL